MVTTSPVTPMPIHDRERWVDEHLQSVPERVASFLDDGGSEWAQQDLLDLGCGDGLIAVGLMRRFQLRSVTAVDEAKVDEALLDEVLRASGVARPPNVQFAQHPAGRLPYSDGTFDVVFTWSVAEHVADLRSFFSETFRCLRPDGMLFIQTWPLWWSEHGSHLWEWIPEGFVHLSTDRDELVRLVEATDTEDPVWRRHLLGAFRSTNEATLDELQTAIRGAGFRLAKVSCETDPFHVPPQLQDVPLSRLAISGAMLLAVRPQTIA